MGGSPAKSSTVNPYSQQFGQAVQEFRGANEPLMAQGLNPYEQQQMQLIDQGRQSGQQQIREQATARGMFSSGGAITDEALLEQQLAQQRAGIYGQAQNRYMQGLGNLQNVAQLYGSQQQSQSRGESGGFLGGIGGLIGAAIPGGR